MRSVFDQGKGNSTAAQRMASVFDSGDIYTKASNMENKDETKLLHIVNDNPLKLDITVGKALTTTDKLAMQINEVFKPMFTDWYGSEIAINANGTLGVNFVFKAIIGTSDRDRDHMAFTRIEMAQEKTANNMLNRINAYNSMRNSNLHNFEFTSWGAELIYDLMSNNDKRGVNPTKVETMRRCFAESSENVNNGYSLINNIYCTVYNLDIYKILGVVFGLKDDDGHNLLYNIMPIRPVSELNIARSNYVIDIEVMSMEDYNRAMAEIGNNSMPGTITAVTGTLSDLK